MGKLNTYSPLILILLSACVAPTTPEEGAWEGGGKADGFDPGVADTIGEACEPGACPDGLGCFRGVCTMECDGVCPGANTFCVGDPTRNRDYGPFVNPAAVPEWRGLCMRLADGDADCHHPETYWEVECCRVNQGGEFHNSEGTLMCRGDHSTSRARGVKYGGYRYEVAERWLGDSDAAPAERGVCMPYRVEDCGDDGRGYDWSTPGY